MHYLIATHSLMAEGLADAAKLLIGQRDDISIITAYVDNDNFEKEFYEKLDTILDEYIIVLTDLLGGSVNQVVTKYRGSKRLEIITGVNLALLMRALTIDPDCDIPTQIRECVSTAQEQMIFINSFLNKREKGE